MRPAPCNTLLTALCKVGDAVRLKARVDKPVKRSYSARPADPCWHCCKLALILSMQKPRVGQCPVHNLPGWGYWLTNIGYGRASRAPKATNWLYRASSKKRRNRKECHAHTTEQSPHNGCGRLLQMKASPDAGH